jgi:hypothetical protein
MVKENKGEDGNVFLLWVMLLRPEDADSWSRIVGCLMSNEKMDAVVAQLDYY